MTYIIYENIRKSRFDELKHTIKCIESVVSTTLSKSNFFVEKDDDYSAFLGIDFRFDNTQILGNIGFSYNEELSTENYELFDFYILKARDKNNIRLFLKQTLDKHYTLSEILSNSVSLFEECILVFHSINDEKLLPIELKY